MMMIHTRVPRCTPVAGVLQPKHHQRLRATNHTLRYPKKHTLRTHSVQCGAGKVQKLNAEELEIALQTRDKPLIIDFMATWCGPCLLMAQELEKVAEEMGDTVRIVKVDTDEEPDLSTQLQIQGLPTLVYVGVGDKPALRTEGLLPAATIKEIITEELMGNSGKNGNA